MRRAIHVGAIACLSLSCGEPDGGRSTGGLSGLDTPGTDGEGGGKGAGAGSDDAGDDDDAADGAGTGHAFDVGAGAGDGDGGPPTCPIPEMLVVLDRSFSMRQVPSGAGAAGQIANSKWAHAISAVEGFAMTYEDSIAIGLGLFPSPVDPEYCLTITEIENHEVTGKLCEVGPGAAPEPGNAVTIDGMLDAETTALCRGTPIEGALADAGDVLAAGGGDSRNIVLVTDGKDRCGGDPVARTKLLAQADVRVFAIGFGNTMADAEGHETLNAIACAGETAVDFANNCVADGLGGYDPIDPLGPALYIAAEDGDALASAFEDQIAGVLCCGTACPPG